MKPLLATFIGLLVIGTVAAESKKLVTEADCGEDEKFLECGTCEPTCEDESPMCVMMCTDPMCMCETGKVRNPDGKCVLPAQCAPYNSTKPGKPEKPTPVCRQNEGVKHCSGCEPSCDTPNPFCTKICRQLNICECLPNFYRHNGTGECVPAEACPEGSAARQPRDIPPVNPDQKCGANEVLKQCSGCENKCGRPQIMCKMMCNNIPKCECDTGFFRDNRTNQCVPQEQCAGPVAPSFPPSSNKTCGANEALRSCPGCEPTCKNQNPICTLECRLGQECQCIQGYVRNDAGKCVKPKECSSTGSQCGDNEELKTCPGCEPTCANPNPICPAVCRLGEACQCSSGFVRNDAGKCIRQEECASSTNNTATECAANERMTPCSGCEANCAALDRMCPMMCNNIPKCECAPGFARNAMNQCVPRDQCSNIRPPRDNGTQTCKANEALVNCPGCEATCANKSPVCLEICRPGQACQCNQGFYRNAQGNCVTENDCDVANPPSSSNSSTTCPRNEKYMACGSCEGSCTEHNPICTKQCRPAGCYCPTGDGYVRNTRGQCVHKTMCEGGNNNGGDEEYNPCAATTCPVGSDCIKVPVQCIRAPCPPQAQCVPQNSTRPTRTPNDDPCATLRCAAGTRCIVNIVQCFTEPCPPQAQCVPIADPEPTPAPINPCAAMLCPANTRCEFVQINCIKAPCPPSRAQCVPIEGTRPTRDVDDIQISDPCATMRCGFNTRCENVQVACKKAPCPVKGQCVPVDDTPTLTCATVDCISGSHCVMQEVQCIKAPCHPVPTCVPNNETRPSRSTDDVLASDPCATKRCRDGMVCSKVLVNCLRNSQGCRPRGVCVPANANGQPEVRPSRSVEETNNNNDPCAVIDCRSGMRCVVAMPSCLEGATDCGPRGICVNMTEQPQILPPVAISDPPPQNIQNKFCMMARCAHGCITTGIKCNEDGSECEYLGQCVPEGKDVSNLDVCANSTCPKNKVCNAQVVQCFAPPCPPIPQCIEERHAAVDVCANHTCAPDEECQQLRIRCNRVVPNCNPIPRCVKKNQKSQ